MGRILYLAVQAKPYRCMATSVSGFFVVSDTKKLLNIVKEVLCYLKGTRDIV